MRSAVFLFLLLLIATDAFAPVQVPKYIKNIARTKSTSERNAINNNVLSREENNSSLTKRRSFVSRNFATFGASFLFPNLSSITFAVDKLSLSAFKDPDFNFQIGIPIDWVTTEQDLSGRRKGVFFTDPSSKDAETGSIETLGFIAYTPLRDDFTSLGSFGSVDEVAQATILPKGELAGEQSSSKMLEAVSKNNSYFFDYVATPVVPNQSGAQLTKALKQQHFRTIFTLLPFKSNAGLTLVTITFQTTEERYSGLKGLFDEIIESYGKV